MSNKYKKPKVIVIVGPTASGKSGLAVTIAKKFNGEVISADSRQVYKGFNLGAGKITKGEKKGVVHYLLDVANPKRTFSAAQYQKIAKQALNKILKRGKLPIICGGTGFYIRSLIDGSILPEVKPNYRLRKGLSEKSVAELFKMLQEKDPVRAKNIDPHNPARLIRSLEIVAALGKVPAAKINPLPAEILMLGINKDKKELKRLIGKRLIKRINSGMLQEIKNLHTHGLSWQRLKKFGLEYKYGALLLQNKISKSRFTEELIRASLKYAKRQMTWFKKDKRIHWLNDKREAQKLIAIFLA